MMLFLLLVIGSGGAWGQNAGFIDPGNTLVTGVVMKGGMLDVMCDMEVEIRCKKVLLMKTVARHGLIHVDLKGLAEPSDWLEITVKPISFQSEHGYRVNIYSAVISVRLANAQNMPIEVPSDIYHKFEPKKNVRGIRIADSGEVTWELLR
jgi:hypothetical protein